MRIIKLMPDYGCFPLWEASPDVAGNTDPRTLPLSAGLILALDQWAKLYDSTLDPDDPRKSGFSSSEQERNFVSAGHRLSIQMQRELGSEFRVVLKI